MKLDPSKTVLIVGLGLIGGSYAKALTSRGFSVYGVDTDPAAVSYALENGVVEKASVNAEPELIAAADIAVLALYPHLVVDWVRQNQAAFHPGAVITDVTGVKSCVVYDVQAILREDLEFIAAHPMAGREVYGIENSDPSIFREANYIVVPTDQNTLYGIELCRALGRTLGFANVTALPPRVHDEMIGFVSQLTHCIAVCLMTCSESEHLVDYTGDSFRDLTRIARINEEMWCELFMLNRGPLLEQMDRFLEEFRGFRELLAQGDEEGMKEKMRLSSRNRALFDRKKGEEPHDI